MRLKCIGHAVMLSAFFQWYIRVYRLRRHSQETAQLSSLVAVSSGMPISTVQECVRMGD